MFQVQLGGMIAEERLKDLLREAERDRTAYLASTSEEDYPWRVGWAVDFSHAR